MSDKVQLSSIQTWMIEAWQALDAARIIGERHETPLNYGNIARLLETIPDSKATRMDWCSEHGSMMQQTICEKYDLACRRVGKNPFAAKKPPCVRSSVLIVEEQQ